jgi:hypothetical protein
LITNHRSRTKEVVVQHTEHRDLAAVVYDLAVTPTFTWFGPPPTGPGAPFGNPSLIVFDSLRVLVGAVGVVGITFAWALIRRPNGAIGQRIRLFAETGMIFYAMITEAWRIGDYANLRLMLAVVVTVAAAWGNYLGVRYENPPPPRVVGWR